MTFAPTLYFMAATAIIWIAYDIWVVWAKGGQATESSNLLSLWVLHPFVMSPVFVLAGHLFWPKCGSADAQSISPMLGTLIGILAIGVILLEVFTRMAPPPQCVFSLRYLIRLAVLACACVAAGHVFFAQYVPCTGGA